MSELTQQDLEGKSIEELDELLRNPEKMAGIQPEQPPLPVAETVPPEPTEEKPPEAPPVPTEPKPEEAPEGPSEAEILKAQIAALEANNKKMEARLAGRESGERGFIKQLQNRIKALESGASRRTDSEYEPVAEEPPEQPVRKVEPPTRDSVAAWAVGRAVQEAAANFVANHPGYDEMSKEITEYITNSGYDSSAILMSGDPIEASKETTRLLDEAYWHVNAAHKVKAAAELQTKKADQMRRLEEVKAKAAVSASGAAPAPKPKAKSYDDMTLAELDAELRRLTKR
jgi:hypothetical protein